MEPVVGDRASRVKAGGVDPVAGPASVVFLVDVDIRLSDLLHNKRARRAALLAAIWVPAITVLIVVREVLLPFLLAMLFAYLLAPSVRWLSARRVTGRAMPPWAAVLTLYIGFGVLLYAGTVLFVPQVYREFARLAKDATELLNHLDDDNLARLGVKLEAIFEQYRLPIHIVTPGAPGDATSPDGVRELNVDLVELTQSVARDARAWLSAEASLLFNQLQRVLAGVVGFVFKTFLVFMLTAFLAADSTRILDFVFSVTPIADRAHLQDLLLRIDHGLSGVVRGQLTICLVNGVLTLAGLLLLEVKFAFLLATVAAVFSLVPIFGSILSTIPIVLVAMSTGPSTAALALLWIVGIHALEANLLNPKILGDAAKIHPALVVLALIVGEHYYGIVGALLAVPLMSILVTIFRAAHTRAMQLDDEIAAAERTPQPAPREQRRPRRLVRENLSA